MKIPSAILATVAFLVASASAQQEPLDVANPNANEQQQQGLIEPTVAEPIGFIDAGKGGFLPFTSSEFEGLERGEWPQSRPSAPTPQTDEQFKASGLPDYEIERILNDHNYYRWLHGSPPLRWNWEAANFGENWLQYCAFQHTGGKFGENLAAGHHDFPTAIKAWYDEVNQYNFDAPGFYSATGHFTQVVWKDTTSVGCAKRACPNWTIYICNYEPAGNIVTWDNSYFRNNVTPRQR
ncbi:MAG: CAP domain-containing protein [Linnemannia gamsii]|nr:MAG: CAP domain-containing protein [Linnemannia gamsii]